MLMRPFWRAVPVQNRLGSLSENETETDETHKKKTDSSVSGTLPREHIEEFQKIAYEVAGMKLTYSEAWEAGHSLVRFFDLLINGDES